MSEESKTALETPTPKSRERLWLALAPAFVYVFAFTFEAGYATHFGIPSDLIRLDLERILTVGGSLLVLVVTTGFLFLFLPIPARAPKIVLDRIALTAILGLFAVAAFQAKGGWILTIWKVVITAIFLGNVYYQLIQPITKYTGSLLDRWEAATNAFYESHKKSMSGSLYDVGMQRLKALTDIRFVMRVYWFLFVGLMISYWGGWLTGHGQETFLVDPDMPRMLLLRRWGGHFIGVAIDSASGALTHDFRLVPVSDLKSERLVLIRMRAPSSAPVDTLPPWNRVNSGVPTSAPQPVMTRKTVP